jgi:hypothetical protein
MILSWDQIGFISIAQSLLTTTRCFLPQLTSRKHLMSPNYYNRLYVELFCLLDQLHLPHLPQIPIHLLYRKPLTQFSSIFAAPIGLPPKGACGHTIPLLPKAKIVNQRHTNFPIKRIHWKKSSRNCCNNE